MLSLGDNYEGEDDTNKLSGLMFSHGNNYEWLIGRLHQVHVPRAGWKIRYAPTDVQDRWGGSMVLAPDTRLEDYVDGDTVYIEGKILSKRAGLNLSGPRYRVKLIRPISENDTNRLARDIRKHGPKVMPLRSL